MELLYEDETHILRRCFFDVQNEVGLGRHEEAYHRACRIWFAENDVPVASKLPHRVMLEGEEAHLLFPDFVAWSAIPIETKALPRKLGPSDWVQLLNYMNCRGNSLGLIVNFGLDRVHVERVIHEPHETRLVENWDRWQATIGGTARDTGMKMRDAVHAIYRAHSTGYSDDIVSKLMLCALRNREVTIVVNPLAKAMYRNTEVHESSIDCVLVNNEIVLVHTALFESNGFNISRGLSFMKALGVSFGLAVNFGKNIVEITALARSFA
jgi:GxxExxY protein